MLAAQYESWTDPIAVASAVVFGMAVNALVGTLFVPNFWLVMQRFREKYLGKLFSGADEISENNS